MSSNEGLKSWLEPGFLRQVQAGSGLAMSTFLMLHIPTTMSATTGPYGYNEALKLFRRYYQHPIVECGLALSCVAHVAAGMALWKKRSERTTTYAEPLHSRLNHYTGRVLASLLPIHVTATRIMSLLGKQQASEFDHVRSSLVGLPGVIFIPYYSLLAVSGVYHALQGIVRALHQFQLIPATWYPTMIKSKVWYIFIGSVCAATLGGLYGFIANEGIPSSAKYWLGELPSFLRRGNSIAAF